MTRPGQPIEYWGECATLRVGCTARAGTRREAAVTCTVRAKRPSAGRATVTVIDEAGVRHARGSGTLDGRTLVVRPAASRPFAPGTYQAVALLERGGTARTFWTFFRAR